MIRAPRSTGAWARRQAPALAWARGGVLSLRDVVQARQAVAVLVAVVGVPLVAVAAVAVVAVVVAAVVAVGVPRSPPGHPASRL